MAKRIYVGSLPYSMDETQLQSMFAQYGQVSEVHIVTDQYSGQAKGFAFVEMADEGEANKAIQALNGTSVGGRTLIVNEARPREARSGGSSGGDHRGGGSRRW